MTYRYETTCHLISGVRTLGEEVYDKTMDRHLNKMGKDNWELVAVQKATQVLSVDHNSTLDFTEEQLNNYSSPREVFVFFWRKKIDNPPVPG